MEKNTPNNRAIITFETKIPAKVIKNIKIAKKGDKVGIKIEEQIPKLKTAR